MSTQRPGSSPGWAPDDLPDIAGRVFVVTGANSGIGFEAARHLARRGARVVLACRNAEKGRAAADAIRTASPKADLEARALDLADLASVRAFAAEAASDYTAIDVLVNNAGVMAIPLRRTADGFEMQFGTNHLGHFALTALLADRVRAAKRGRIVTISSVAHRRGRMRWDDLNWERGYRTWAAYGQSKLANLLFHYELARRIDDSGAPFASVACHPGYTATNLQYAGPEMRNSAAERVVMSLGVTLFAQGAEMGALPTLYAAAAEGVQNGEYIGPDGLLEFWGRPTRVESARHARDLRSMARLWEVSEKLTGVRFEV